MWAGDGLALGVAGRAIAWTAACAYQRCETRHRPMLRLDLAQEQRRQQHSYHVLRGSCMSSLRNIGQRIGCQGSAIAVGVDAGEHGVNWPSGEEIDEWLV